MIKIPLVFVFFFLLLLLKVKADCHMVMAAFTFSFSFLGPYSYDDLSCPSTKSMIDLINTPINICYECAHILALTSMIWYLHQKVNIYVREILIVLILF